MNLLIACVQNDLGILTIEMQERVKHAEKAIRQTSCPSLQGGKVIKIEISNAQGFGEALAEILCLAV